MTLTLDPTTLARHTISVPRYTSYPTVPEWKDELTGAQWTAALDEAPEKDVDLALYVHLPFCEKLCWFCGCNMIITHDRSKSETYLAHLEREIEQVAARRTSKRPVVQMHWGGGTPTYLNEAELTRLWDTLHRHFDFADEAEIGLEVDPRETPPEKVRHLRKLGFNRLSMGVQDFDAEVQTAVNRIQPEDMTRRVFDAAREVGLTGLNVDLMYGLPHQSAERFAKSVDIVIDMQPDRIALFHYAHLPKMIKHQKVIDEAALPTSDVKFRLFTQAVERFTAAGYDFIGMDHFARPDDELARARRDGTLKRNFNGYTTHKHTDLVGLGVTAISNVGRHYVQNVKDLREWSSIVDGGDLAPARACVMSDDDRLRRDVIYRLMCQGEVDPGAVERDWGIDFATYFADELRDVEIDRADGLLTGDRSRLELTPLGCVLMRNVARRFDAYTRRRRAGEGPEFSRST